MIDRMRQVLWRRLNRAAIAADRRFQAVVAAAKDHEDRLAGLSDAELDAEIADFALPADPDDDALILWCALGREASDRAVNLRPFDVQLLGALRMLGGDVVEMATGEGKTLSGALAAAGYAAQGRSVHLVSVNDYLARRDAQWMGPLLRRMGVSVGWIDSTSTPDQRRDAYRAQVTYAPVNEIGFDLLRDRLCLDPPDQVASDPDVALIDEIDAVLVDEARIPLVLAGAEEVVDPEGDLVALVATLHEGDDYEIDTERRNVHLTTAGANRVSKRLGGIDLFSAEHIESTLTRVNVALHAQVLLQRDVHYLVRDGRVALIDPSRGRVAALQRWPDGLHAAVEAKEGLAATGNGLILDTITIQALMNRYPRLCGMTGTALAAGESLSEFYKLEVGVIAPNVECRRIDEPDRIYATGDDKEDAIVSLVKTEHSTGRPVLVATLDVAESERLAGRFADIGLECAVLNARNDAEEAQIIAGAGALNAITISTQMAGRGTDIRLGGPDGADHDQVAELEGLYVIGTGHHPSSRLDDQLRGRAGRQGDPGGSVFFASFDDDQIQRYGGEFTRPKSSAYDGQVDTGAYQRLFTRAQLVSEGTDATILGITAKFNRPVERQRDTVLERRDALLHNDDASRLMAEHCPDRYEELTQKLSEEAVALGARQIALHHLDTAWSDHLAFVADLRESIHLRSLGRQDPLVEFIRDIFAAFKPLVADAEKAAIEDFERVEFTDAGADLEGAGLKRPSATWTYVAQENPFGSEFERVVRNLAAMMRPKKR